MKDEASYIHFSTDAVDFESSPLEDGSRHLLDGGVAGASNEVVAFVRAVSRLFTEAGIQHSFEVYDNNHNLVQLISNE